MGIFDLYTKTDFFQLLNEYYRKPPEKRKSSINTFINSIEQASSIHYDCYRQLETIAYNEIDLFLCNVASSLFYSLEIIPCNILVIRWIENKYIPDCFGMNHEELTKGLILKIEVF